MLALVLACALAVASFAPIRTEAKTTLTAKSKIDGSTIKCSADGSVSKMLKTEAYAAWDSKPDVFVQNITPWSKGKAITTNFSQGTEGQFEQFCHFKGDASAMRDLISDYTELLEQYGFTCDGSENTAVTGYEYMVTRRFTYNGSEYVTRNSCDSVLDGSYDAEISYWKDNYKDYAFISITLPKEVGVRDFGERRSGGKVSDPQSVFKKKNTSDRSFWLKWGEYDTFYIYAFDDPEDYIQIKLKPGAYKTGSKFDFQDFKSSKKVSYSILSHEITEDDLYCYIEPFSSNKNQRMVKDFQVKVLKSDKNVKSIYYYIVLCDYHAYNYVLEGVFVDDARVKQASRMNFKSNGSTKTLKNGATVTAKNGTTYKMKKGSTVTLKNPASGAGYDFYVYSFYANQDGIVKTGQYSSKSSSAKITAQKAGTIYYKVGFTGSQKKLKVNKIKVPGTSSQYTTSKYYVYESKTKDQIIKIVVTD